ncbi:Deferrochelatase/peroxidase EfeB precursor [Serratia entomophila]|uniref:iron uptake transporter deferrochelatase/peroxidase subunit n=1 Tax=Serratia entomophila TaxID=42906 RepID=UPI001F3CC0F5|nr:iron uptake transporter deferrochelatase/peroxidase subunit [Serratia entomophila]UIW16622.1 deferrochelatase/peroxidase EfeB [Serratia entomophila]CAI0698583.1 Deferrochelatase/peroxidase EfeB precursor [Serratia entomophila]CAI0699327.1 Deferrochelatase/peroxidase EfeB precursor [Serratia entomophila]CAI0699358.1 Deferrochelatase/peroxidase EfeB precursor [Serratia entomophila]CAI0739487.1 Deferrochelatase/peroxidase EfeB precursor [Serratia entomophila]
MSDKIGPDNGPHPQQQGAASPSRRRLLQGLGLGALALGGTRLARAADKPAEALANAQDERWQKQPFYGRHQAGVLTPQQAAMMLVAFDVLATDKQELERLFRLLTDRIAFLTRGGKAPEVDPKLPPLDSGIMGPEIYPDNLTVTVSVGSSLFDERFGLQAQKPLRLQRMTRFPNDSLDASLCHGDLVLQICANTNETVIHALRDIIKHSPDLLSVRWKREGFISAHSARSKGKETPINLLGFKDGTGNPKTDDKPLMDRVVWVGDSAGEPAWAVGGSYQAARIIRFHVEFWDRTPLQEQQTIFGREKHSGAPLGMQHEHDEPDYDKDPEGKVIPMDAHIRLANPRTAESQSNLLLRRGYSYSIGVSNSGQLEMGLLFVCYQADLEKGFLTVQKRLNGEALEEYIKPIGGGYFFVLPGVKDSQDYLASGLLKA